MKSNKAWKNWAVNCPACLNDIHWPGPETAVLVLDVSILISIVGVEDSLHDKTMMCHVIELYNALQRYPVPKVSVTLKVQSVHPVDKVST